MTTGMTTPYRLHYAPDNASLIIRLTLEEMGLPYETVLVDRSKAEQKSSEYRKLNPVGRIPVLVTPNGPISETAAILLWLADTHGAMAPAPNDAERADFLRWLFFVSNTVHAELTIVFYTKRYAGPSEAARALVQDHVKQHLVEYFGFLDALAGGEPSWLHPEQPSVLGYYIACLCRWAALYPQQADRSWFRLADYPDLHRLLAALENRPAVQSAQIAEGLGPTPFTAPSPCTPPEGSAL